MTSPQPLRGEGDLPKGDITSGRYSIILFIKMGDKGVGGVKNLKKWMTSFMDGPLYALVDNTYFRAM